MHIISFLKLAEIQTKAASMIPFLLGTLYGVYRYGRFSGRNFLFMLISLLAIDMVTTVINNFIDFKKANRRFGYNYESHNAIVRYNLKESSVIAVIAALLSLAVVSGLLLYLNTSIVVLILGAVAFMVGIFYSLGPLPISRMPLGEVFSGFFMGFVILFLSVYIHNPNAGIASVVYSEGRLMIDVGIWETVILFLASVPAMVGIANIMLANNICDVEDDLINRRYTLPVYIGVKRALLLYKGLYVLAYLVIALLLILGHLPITGALALITLIPVVKNIRLFQAKQSKKETFITAVQNFVLLNSALAAGIGLGLLLR